MGGCGWKVEGGGCAGQMWHAGVQTSSGLRERTAAQPDAEPPSRAAIAAESASAPFHESIDFTTGEARLPEPETPSQQPLSSPTSGASGCAAEQKLHTQVFGWHLHNHFCLVPPFTMVQYNQVLSENVGMLYNFSCLLRPQGDRATLFRHILPKHNSLLVSILSRLGRRTGCNNCKIGTKSAFTS